jgi:hypothetical protein
LLTADSSGEAPQAFIRLYDAESWGPIPPFSWRAEKGLTRPVCGINIEHMFDHEGTPVKPPDEPGPAVDPAATDPAELSDDELDSQTQALWAHVHVAMGRAVALQAEINRRGLWGTWGARSPGQWLSWRAGLSGTEANRLCAVAERIDDCPGTKKALTAGELSLAKAAAITRVATDATEDTLLHYARHAPTPELEAIARAYRKVTESAQDDTPTATAGAS